MYLHQRNLLCITSLGFLGSNWLSSGCSHSKYLGWFSLEVIAFHEMMLSHLPFILSSIADSIRNYHPTHSANQIYEYPPSSYWSNGRLEHIELCLPLWTLRNAIYKITLLSSSYS